MSLNKSNNQNKTQSSSHETNCNNKVNQNKKRRKKKKKETEADLTQPGLHALGGEEDQRQWVGDLHRHLQRPPLSLSLSDFCGAISLIFFSLFNDNETKKE